MSSGSESDEDYVPGEPEKLSEEESADEETENQYENEVEDKVKKRKALVGKNKKVKRPRKDKNDIKTEIRSEREQSPEPVKPEEEKKREEDLWAQFLEGTDTKPKPVSKQNNINAAGVKPEESNDKKNEDKKTGENIKEKERRIFEFAGEKIIVENNVIKERLTADETSLEVIAESSKSLKTTPSSSTKPGGLSNILGQLNKKNKLSTLEKSKLDWVTYKHEEGIDDEIKSHNKGKQGFLDRRDFLERADMRQYEIERELRTSRRSNR